MVIFSDSSTDTDLDGFTNLDDYLSWMAKPHYLTKMCTAVAIDMKKQFPVARSLYVTCG